MDLTQFLGQKTIQVGQKEVVVYEMTAADRVKVLDVCSTIFNQAEVTMAYQLSLTAIVIQKSLRGENGELTYTEDQLQMMINTYSRSGLQALFNAACELSELDFLLGKPVNRQASETSQTAVTH